MKKLLYTLIILFCGATAQAQVLMDEGFDNGIPERWTMFSDTNTTHNEAYRDAWVLSNEYGNPVPGVISASWFLTPGRADRWLITDTVTIPDSGYVFSIEAAAYEQAYADGFAVKVSKNGRMFRHNFDMGYLMQVPQCGGGMEAYTASLDAYVGQRIHIAIIQNSNDKNFLIVDNVKVYKPEQHAVALRHIEIPQYTQTYSPFTPTATIQNTGLQTIYNLHVDYIVDDDTIRTIFDDIELFPNASVNLTLPSHSINLPGDHLLSVHAYLPNGFDDNDDDNSLSQYIRVYNISQTTTRNTLVEEFSDLNNGYSISGHNTIAEALNGFVHCNTIVHHISPDDALSNSGSRALRFFFSDTNNIFTPAVMFDRRKVGNNPDAVIYPGSSSNLQTNLIQAQQVPSFVKMNMNLFLFDESSRTMAGNVTGQFLLNDCDSNTRIVAYLVEDSVYSHQFDYTNGTPDDNYYIYYRPMNIVRCALTSPMGDPLTVDSNGRFTHPISFQLPTSYRAWRCRVVAAIYHLDSLSSQCEVLNSGRSFNLRSSYYGIEDVPNDIEMDVYPNPATDRLQISSKEAIQKATITDVMGRTVHETSHTEGQDCTINIQSLPQGIYFVTIKTTQGTATRKVIKID